jgi:hypothetical protein
MRFDGEETTGFPAGDCNCECMKSKGLDGKAHSFEVMPGYEVIALDQWNCHMKREEIGKRFGPGKHYD